MATPPPAAAAAAAPAAPRWRQRNTVRFLKPGGTPPLAITTPLREDGDAGTALSSPAAAASGPGAADTASGAAAFSPSPLIDAAAASAGDAPPTLPVVLPPQLLIPLPDSIPTHRMVLLPPRVGDGAALNEARVESWPNLLKWFAKGDPPTVEQSEEKVRQNLVGWHDRSFCQYYMWDKDAVGSRLLGCIAFLRNSWHVPQVELGYWLRDSATGKGLMTEAVAAMERVAVEVLHVRRIDIHIDLANVKSMGVPRRLGYTLEGIRRNADRHHITNQLIDIVVYVKTYPDELAPAGHAAAGKSASADGPAAAAAAAADSGAGGAAAGAGSTSSFASPSAEGVAAGKTSAGAKGREAVAGAAASAGDAAVSDTAVAGSSVVDSITETGTAKSATDSASFHVRPLNLDDPDELAAAERLTHRAFGTMIGHDDPEHYQQGCAFLAWRAVLPHVLTLVAVSGRELASDGDSATRPDSGDGKLVGVAAATAWGQWVGIGPVAVDPSAWRQGVAAALMQGLMTRITREECRTSHVALYTYAGSLKHSNLYAKSDMWPRFPLVVCNAPAEAALKVTAAAAADAAVAAVSDDPMMLLTVAGAVAPHDDGTVAVGDVWRVVRAREAVGTGVMTLGDVERVCSGVSRLCGASASFDLGVECRELCARGPGDVILLLQGNESTDAGVATADNVVAIAAAHAGVGSEARTPQECVLLKFVAVSSRRCDMCPALTLAPGAVDTSGRAAVFGDVATISLRKARLARLLHACCEFALTRRLRTVAFGVSLEARAAYECVRALREPELLGCREVSGGVTCHYLNDRGFAADTFLLCDLR